MTKKNGSGNFSRRLRLLHFFLCVLAWVAQSLNLKVFVCRISMKRINGTTLGNNTQHLKVQSDPLDTQHCVQAITHEKILLCQACLTTVHC